MTGPPTRALPLDPIKMQVLLWVTHRAMKKASPSRSFTPAFKKLLSLADYFLSLCESGTPSEWRTKTRPDALLGPRPATIVEGELPTTVRKFITPDVGAPDPTNWSSASSSSGSDDNVELEVSHQAAQGARSRRRPRSSSGSVEEGDRDERSQRLRTTNASLDGRVESRGELLEIMRELQQERIRLYQLHAPASVSVVLRTDPEPSELKLFSGERDLEEASQRMEGDGADI